MQQFIFEITYKAPEKIFGIFAQEEGSIFLDSSDTKSPHAKFSFIGFSPVEKIICQHGRTEINTAEFNLKFRNNPFDVIKKRLAAWNEFTQLAKPHVLPFTNGAAGFFAYDLGRYFEKIPSIALDDKHIPDMALGLYDQVIGFDIANKKAWFCVIAADKAKATARLDILTARLDNIKQTSFVSPTLQWERSRTKEEYKQDIQTVIDYIHAGDAFQVNLSQKFTASIPDDFDAYAHYLHLRSINPAPFAAYLNIEGTILSSSSPERFLKVSNGKAETRPIKGTMADHENAENLRTSDKNRAENIMIVDLLRNDLSKVCEASSVSVPELCSVESYSGLHHLVSSVTGTLKPHIDPLDAFAACFPGGSITGAPKIRAMEIIDELEPTRRGAYCGAIGYIGLDGNMDTNIAIRTLSYKNGYVHLNAGGGIVADSDAESEYQETIVKARRIFESFEAQEQHAKLEKIA